MFSYKDCQTRQDPTNRENEDKQGDNAFSKAVAIAPDEPQWCNLTLVRRFWVTKVCLRVSGNSQICLVSQLGEQLFEKQILKIILDIFS